jgi:hypothetical protein
MQLKRTNDEKLFKDIAIRQIADDYKAQGYTVFNERIGKYLPDLVVKKGFDRIVIEVVTGEPTKEKLQKLQEIRNYIAHHSGDLYKFNVVVTNPPKYRSIEILGIDLALSNYFSSISIPDFDEVAKNYEIRNVHNIDIKDVIFDRGKILATGHGLISLSLEYGSNSDIRKGDGLQMSQDFPFDFKAQFKYDQKKEELVLEDIRHLKFDTSSFFE